MAERSERRHVTECEEIPGDPPLVVHRPSTEQMEGVWSVDCSCGWKGYGEYSADADAMDDWQNHTDDVARANWGCCDIHNDLCSKPGETCCEQCPTEDTLATERCSVCEQDRDDLSTGGGVTICADCAAVGEATDA